MLPYRKLAAIHLAAGNTVDFFLTSTMNKTHHGPDTAPFLRTFIYLAILDVCIISQQSFLFLLLLICCGYPQCEAQGTFVIIFFIYRDLQSGNKNGKWLKQHAGCSGMHL